MENDNIEKEAEIVIQWIMENRGPNGPLNLSVIETLTGIPKSTLHQVKRGVMAFPEKWKPALVEWAKKFGAPIKPL